MTTRVYASSITLSTMTNQLAVPFVLSEIREASERIETKTCARVTVLGLMKKYREQITYDMAAGEDHTHMFLKREEFRVVPTNDDMRMACKWATKHLETGFVFHHHPSRSSAPSTISIQWK